MIEQSRRTYRDAPPAAAPVDKARVLAHLQTQLALLEASREVAHGDA
ncbi:hypothetical protein [Massilia yuzhufengensis]|nr:hypothetical protein [Massilia yuzhufengensis]